MAKRQLHRLAAKQVENLSRPGRHSDGGGLYFFVGDRGRRSWVFIYRERTTGKLKEIGFGGAKGKGKDGLSLADARLKAEQARAMIRSGRDPAAERKAETMKSITFGEFADDLLAAIRTGFKSKSSHTDWKRDLEVRCAPLRPKALRDISTNDVLGVLTPIWLTIPRAATDTRGRIERVFDAAKAKGLRSGENPARWRGNLKELLPRKKKSKRHHKAAPYTEMPKIVRALREKHAAADTTVNHAAEFVILTAVRTSEARFMRVKEIDFKAALWTVPMERMKMDDEHEVPLSTRAIGILKAVVPKGAKPDDYVFEGQRSKTREKPLGMAAVLRALQAVYPAMTTHGCRSSFRDWAGDMTSFPREIAEMALSHKVGDEVEQAYRRGTALEKRRKLMEAWGRYIEGGSSSAAPMRAA